MDKTLWEKLSAGKKEAVRFSAIWKLIRDTLSKIVSERAVATSVFIVLSPAGSALGSDVLAPYLDSSAFYGLFSTHISTPIPLLPAPSASSSQAHAGTWQKAACPSATPPASSLAGAAAGGVNTASTPSAAQMVNLPQAAACAGVPTASTSAPPSQIAAPLPQDIAVNLPNLATDVLFCDRMVFDIPMLPIRTGTMAAGPGLPILPGPSLRQTPQLLELQPLSPLRSALLLPLWPLLVQLSRLPPPPLLLMLGLILSPLPRRWPIPLLPGLLPPWPEPILLPLPRSSPVLLVLTLPCLALLLISCSVPPQAKPHGIFHANPHTLLLLDLLPVHLHL
ncbi:hypothetical protein WISP_46209 [Willisornis vidua]|uniref:Uncharacterized protein n=1 Tax=Willisornis vidua TaxID=1566151 RepID=A0ABQ9DJU2_9PASS|nr:hypothetical protein WISP_46209 [Willisornis vidua]